MKRILIKIHWLLSNQLGFNPQRLFQSFLGFPSFISDWRKFRKTYQGALMWMPCLHDRFEEGGTTRSEYFWQDLMVARWIHEANPVKHVDVGSRVDGFVAHVASFREIEVLDVRPNTTAIPGVVFRQADLMQTVSVDTGGYCNSLSCLHALEHFGLGRYGDLIDPLGHEKGLANMAALLKPGGTFYLSCPIGQDRVEFNANRVFDPLTLVDLASNHGLELQHFYVFSNQNGLQEADPGESFVELGKQPYNLGIFIFFKTSRVPLPTNL